MTILSSDGLSLPKRIGNKTAFQQARILSKQAYARALFIHKGSHVHKRSPLKRIRYTEWPILNFSIDKALSDMTYQG